jgi:hypothetical protein
MWDPVNIDKLRECIVKLERKQQKNEEKCKMRSFMLM